MLTGVWAGIVWALAPTVLVGLVFWLVMRSIVRADRTERSVYARMEAEERARRGMVPASASDADPLSPSAQLDAQTPGDPGSATTASSYRR